MIRLRSTDIWLHAPGVVAAYQPIGAPDLLVARQNRGNDGRMAGRNTAMPGVAPTHDPRSGWNFNGTTQYLDSGVIPSTDATWSFLVRFSGVTAAGNLRCQLGMGGGSLMNMFIIDAHSGTPGYGIFANRYFRASAYASLGSGIWGVAKANLYRNGIFAGTLPTDGGGTTTSSFLIGANNSSPINYYTNGSIQSILITSVTLSSAHLWQYSRQMAYCEQNPDWNAWARRRRYYYAPQAVAVDELIANGVTTEFPVYDTPALSQIHALSGISVSTGAPALGTPAITQVHALTATGIATGAPTLGTPVAAETHALTATGIATGEPALGTPAITQVHALTATGIATGVPTLGTPAITQVHVLTATEIATGAPTLGTPVAAETHALTPTGVATGAPTLGTPAIAQVHLLAAPALDTTSPSLALPAISQLHVLVAMIIATGAATVGNPYLVQGLMVAPSSRTFSVPSETRSNTVAASSRTRTA